MKIFAVINNYPGANGPIAWYNLPDSSIVKDNNPFFLPETPEDYKVFPSIVWRIGKLGKGFPQRFAHRYFEAAGLAVNVVNTAALANLRANGLPWGPAVAFDRSLLLGPLGDADRLHLENPESTVIFECGSAQLSYSPAKMLVKPTEILSTIARDHTFKNGDLLLGALHNEGISLERNTHLSARLAFGSSQPLSDPTSSIHLLDFRIK